jgi:uncharacterized membrane protein YsdA (DUF1294 family)
MSGIFSVLPGWVPAYLIAVSAAACVLTVYDKAAAKLRIRRIPEATLMLTGAAGGAAAMLAVMLLIRHKTRHAKFMVGLPLIIAAQLCALALASHCLG